MSKKLSNGWDILNAVWGKWETFYDGTHEEEVKNLSWKELINSVSPDTMEEWEKNIVLEHFLFEIKYLYHKPDYKSMRYLWGEHAMLYDVFGCYEHRFIIVTHDDNTGIYEQTIFCPYCNQNKFLTGKMEQYISDIDGKVETPEIWEQTLKIAKWWKNHRRKENFKYQIKKWIEKGYLKYRIKKFLGFYKKNNK